MLGRADGGVGLAVPLRCQLRRLALQRVAGADAVPAAEGAAGPAHGALLHAGSPVVGVLAGGIRAQPLCQVPGAQRDILGRAVVVRVPLLHQVEQAGPGICQGRVFALPPLLVCPTLGAACGADVAGAGTAEDPGLPAEGRAVLPAEPPCLGVTLRAKAVGRLPVLAVIPLLAELWMQRRKAAASAGIAP